MLSILILLLTGLVVSSAEETRSNLFTKKGGDGKYLPYLKRKTVSVEGEIECARECVQDSSCASFNIGPPDDSAKNKCELNFDTNRDTGIELEEKEDWSYYEGVRNVISHCKTSLLVPVVCRIIEAYFSPTPKPHVSLSLL